MTPKQLLIFASVCLVISVWAPAGAVMVGTARDARSALSRAIRSIAIPAVGFVIVSVAMQGVRGWWTLIPSTAAVGLALVAERRIRALAVALTNPADTDAAQT